MSFANGIYVICAWIDILGVPTTISPSGNSSVGDFFSYGVYTSSKCQSTFKNLQFLNLGSDLVIYVTNASIFC